MSHEFPGYTDIRNDVADFDDHDPAAPLHRRQFLALSAAIATATAAGCRRPDLEILPYSAIPEAQQGHVIPGRPTFYATSLPRPGGALPVLVECHEGRPTKIEGNPQHPASGGATDIWAQASILDLYSPDRVMNDRHPGVMYKGQQKTWDDFDAALTSMIPANGDGFYILADKVPSPAVRLAREQLEKKFPKLAWHAYEPFDDTNAIEGARIAFGEPLCVRYDFTKPGRILAIDFDFLGSGSDAILYSREFMTDRSKKRLFVAEKRYTLTGAAADQRYRYSPGSLIPFVEAYSSSPGAELVVIGPDQPALLHAEVHAQQFAGEAIPDIGVILTEPPPESLARLLATLVEDMNTGKVKTLLILGGNPVFNAPADLNFRNALGNVPASIHLSLFHDHTSEACTWHLPLAHPLECWGDTETSDGTLCCVQPMIAPLRHGHSVLEVLGMSLQAKETPYDWVRQSFAKRANISATDKDFGLRFASYKQLGFLLGSARTPKYPRLKRETVRKAIPDWQPVRDVSKDALEVTFHPDPKLLDGRFAMNAWLQELPDPITKLTWDNAALISPNTAAEFNLTTGDMVELTVNGRTIEISVFILPGQADYSIALLAGQYGEMRIAHVPNGGGFDVYKIRDSKNPYITTGCTLRKLDRRYELAVTQEHGEIPEGRDLLHESLSRDAESSQRSAAAPAHPEKPNHAHAGPAIGIAPDGHITDADLRRGFQGPYGNPEFHGTPGTKQPRFPLDLARPEILDSQFQWGMVINLNACTGCSACVVACQAENNIPVVGKTEVIRNREMHWIRIDRYFLDTKSESPRIAHQPVACVHCEAAPCEQVCPVNAAVHSPEGLNLQVYNRCIGTRYCANACPYKVRRFNWFDFNKRGLDELRVPTPLAKNGMAFDDPGIPETLRMQKNPDVSVRMRGVMEKCTYCVQRLEAAKSAAKIAAAEVAQGRRSIPVEEGFLPADGSAHRKPKNPVTAGYDLDDQGRVIVPDGFVKTACQQACPTGAIIFGNTRDSKSKVYAAKQAADEFLLLGELNTKPRTSYLPRVRNENPSLTQSRQDAKESK